MTPPILPDTILERVVRVARRDGITVLAVSGIFAVFSALIGEIWGAAVGIVIAGSGVFEVHGATLLKNRLYHGMRWIVGSQVYLMFAVLAYVWWRIYAFDEGQMRHFIEASSERRDLIEQSGYSVSEFLKLMRTSYIVCYMAVAFLTVVYQGGMTLFFLRRRKAVRAAVGPDLVTSDE